MTATGQNTIELKLADANAPVTGSLAPAADVASRSASESKKTNIFDFDRASLERFFEEELGEKKFRAHQVMKWIHHRYVTDFTEMTDLGKVLRAKLEERAVVHAPQLIFDKKSAVCAHNWLLGIDPRNAI